MTAKLSTEELERLEALAKAATPGPWAWESVNEKGNDWCVGVIVDANDQPVSGRVVGDEDGAVDVFVCSGDGLHNAAYIAAANPSVLLRLLAELAEWKHSHASVMGCLDYEKADVERLKGELEAEGSACAAAQAQVREAEALKGLVADLQAHAKDAGWQDVDDPVAALLAYPLPPPPATVAMQQSCLDAACSERDDLESALAAERQKVTALIEARRWHKSAQGVNEEEAGMASRRLIELLDALGLPSPDAPQPPQRGSLDVIVNGQPVIVQIEAATTLRDVVDAAVNQSGQIGQLSSEWEIREALGDTIYLDQSAYPFLGKRLWVNLRAGMCGEPQPPGTTRETP